MCWKRRRKRRSSQCRLHPHCAAALCLLLFAVVPVSRADKVSELQGRFDKEPHAAAKIRALDKLSEAQFEAANKADKEGDYVTVGFTFEKYRDNIRAAFELLRRQEPDADRHPGPYRQLELQTRKGIREVEQTLTVVSPEMRPPLEIVQKDLLDFDDQLIRLLFPARSAESPKDAPKPEEKPQ